MYCLTSPCTHGSATSRGSPPSVSQASDAAMEKTDETCSPRGITSTFKVQLAASDAVSQCCGLGWKFSFIRAPETVTFNFHPHLLRNAELGVLTVSVSRKDKGGHFIGHRETTVSLPLSGFTPQYIKELISYDTTFNSHPFVKFTVTLPSSSGISLPFSAPPTFDQVVKESLHCGQSLDTKFYVVSRCARGSASCAQPLFANISLLRGLSSDLDACQSFSISLSYRSEPVLSVLSSATQSPEDDILTSGSSKSDVEEYSYESDSDLESESEDPDSMVNAKDCGHSPKMDRTVIINDFAFATCVYRRLDRTASYYHTYLDGRRFSTICILEKSSFCHCAQRMRSL